MRKSWKRTAGRDDHCWERALGRDEESRKSRQLVEKKVVLSLNSKWTADCALVEQDQDEETDVVSQNPRVRSGRLEAGA